MVKGNISDESVFWSIEPWGDGTFYMVNEANGTDWHLANHNGGIILDSNITVPEGGKPPGGQRWTLNPIENAKIDDERFSSVEVSAKVYVILGFGISSNVLSCEVADSYSDLFTTNLTNRITDRLTSRNHIHIHRHTSV
jgi:hypothetical protein